MSDISHMKETIYSLRLTYKCNWKCDYCSADTHSQDTIIDEENILEQISRVPDNSNVQLSGGEPGEVDEETLINILDTLKNKKCTIGINTNGLFLKVYPHLVTKYIEDVLYHCIENIRDRKPIVEYSFDHLELDEHFIYGIVVTNKDDISDVEYYLNEYPFRFSVVGANTCTVNKKHYAGLKKRTGMKIYQLLKDRIYYSHAPMLFLESGVFENCIVMDQGSDS